MIRNFPVSASGVRALAIRNGTVRKPPLRQRTDRTSTDRTARPSADPARLHSTPATTTDTPS